MSSYRKLTGLAAAAALVFAVGAAGTPANAALTFNALTFNALTFNALTAQGSVVAGLNGVAVEAVTAPEENSAPGALVAFEPQPIPPGEEDW